MKNRFEAGATRDPRPRTGSNPIWSRSLLGLTAGMILLGFTLAIPTPCIAQDDSKSKEADPCAQVGKLLEIENPDGRVSAARKLIAKGCVEVPGLIWSTIQVNQWEDGIALQGTDRAWMLVDCVRGRVPEAESLLVRVLETGSWSKDKEMQMVEGILLIEGLKSALTPYRVRLLLDIYEQVESENVQVATITTLRGSKQPEALLPALDAYWNYAGRAKETAARSIELQPEKDAGKTLTRLVGELPKGSLLAWAARLAEQGDVAAAKEALEARSN